MDLTVGIDIWDSSKKTDSPTRKDVLQTYEALPADGVQRGTQSLADAAALGDNAIACGAQAIANGPGALANDDHSVSLGSTANTQVQDSTAVGERTRIRRYGGTVLGQRSVTDGYNGIAIGRRNKIAHDDVILIGNMLVSTVDDEIIIATANTELRVASGILTINGVPVGGSVTPNFAETGSVAITMAAQNVWSAWFELIAATTNEGVGVIAAIVPPHITDSAVRLEVQLGIGAAGVEASFPGAHTIVANPSDVSTDNLGAQNLNFPYSITAGSRIAVRAKFIQAGAAATGTTLVTATILEVV